MSSQMISVQTLNSVRVRARPPAKPSKPTRAELDFGNIFSMDSMDPVSQVDYNLSENVFFQRQKLSM